MLIGIDASRANKPIKTGVEWYSWHLIQELKRLTENDGNSWILYTREPLTGELADLPSNWYEVRAGWPPRRLWTQVRMAWELWRRPIDVFFVPAHVLPRIRPEKSVVTIHDVGFHRMPALYRAADVRYHEATTRHIASTEARIITVSAFAGQELAECYGIDPKRIAITPNGVDHALYRPISDGMAIEERLRTYQVSRPFWLTIGRLEAKKNIVNLVKAFEVYKSNAGMGDPTKLVLIGNPGYGYEVIKRTIAASPNTKDILQLGYVPEEDLPYFLNAADALVHPSFYEGFGIPVVQAMACGTPVIASNAASLPEVIGEGNGLFAPPDQIDALARAMNRLQSEPGLKATLRQRGMERATRYTWKATAQATLPVLTQWIG